MFTDEIYATNTELQRSMALWEKGESGDGPKVEPMKINWQNFEGPWNVKLCELFVQYCVDKGLGNGDPNAYIKEYVADYFENISNIFSIMNVEKVQSRYLCLVF